MKINPTTLLLDNGYTPSGPLYVIHQIDLDPLRSTNLRPHLCGYVKSPREITQEEERNIHVHGGVTFQGRLFENEPDYWVGFDCAHPGDTPEKCNVTYVKDQCEQLARQLKELTQ